MATFDDIFGSLQLSVVGYTKLLRKHVIKATVKLYTSLH